MKKSALAILVICLAAVFVSCKPTVNSDNGSPQEDCAYVGGDLRGNDAARLFSPHKIDGINTGFEVRQCVYSGDNIVIATARKQQEETNCIFYLLDGEKERLKKFAELKVTELYNIDSRAEDCLLVFAKTDAGAAGSILELSSSGIPSEIDLDSFPQAATLKPTQAWWLGENYLLACQSGLFTFDAETGSTNRVFESKGNLCNFFRDQDGSLFFSTNSVEAASDRAETCLYRVEDDGAPELAAKKDSLCAFFPGTGGFCLMSGENKLYKLELATGEESSFAYTGNMPMTGSFLFVSDDRLLFWNLELPLGVARPASQGEYQIINIAGWVPDRESAGAYMEYYTARDGLLQKAIDFAVLSGKDYLPCYTLYEGESGLQELKAALAEGYTPDILDTTWLTPGTGSKYLTDLCPLAADTALQAGLLQSWDTPDTAFEFTPGFIPAAFWGEAVDDNASAAMSRNKFVRLASPLLYSMLLDSTRTDGAAELTAYAASLPEVGDTASFAALPLGDENLFLSGPMSFEQISNNRTDGELNIAALPVFKLGISSGVEGEKLDTCMGFLDFCLTQKECAFLYDRVGVSLNSAASMQLSFSELYLGPDFAPLFESTVDLCADGSPKPEFAVDMLRSNALQVNGDYEYKINADDTVTITKYLGLGGDVTIPSELGGRPVTAIGYTAGDLLGAFQSCAALTSAVIPEGVTDIFYNAFYDCTALKTVTVPASVKVIWNCAFCGCTSLEEIYFQGDAPQFAHYVFDSAGQPTLYHHEGTAGWTNPFYGCDTELY